MRLKDKIGIVTAAASGMGRAGALRFAREGARVAVVDLDAVVKAGLADAIARLASPGGLPILGGQGREPIWTRYRG